MELQEGSHHFTQKHSTPSVFDGYSLAKHKNQAILATTTDRMELQGSHH